MVSGNNPLVTVIIPTHNHAHLLSECLASVRNQTFQDYEIIVINNGSTDNTEKVVKDYAWNQLRYHYQDDTGSVAGPRNTGIKLARGEYVAFLDSDDLWYPQKLEKVMDIFKKNPSIDIVSHDLFLISKNKVKRLLRCGPLTKDMFKSLLIKNCLNGSATVVKRNVILEINGFDERKELVHVEDADAWLKLAYLKKIFSFINEPLGAYRIHDLNLSYDFECLLENEKNMIFNYFKMLNSSFPVYRNLLYRNRLCRIYLKMSVQYFFRKQYAESAHSLLLSLLPNPFYFPFNVALFLKTIR